jgi:four helix bundle protein
VAIYRYRDLAAWQLAAAFKEELFRVQCASDRAQRDLRYRSQLLEAGSVVDKDIAEGFLRRSPRDFARFLGFALGSLAEAEERLRDGIALGYFTSAECEGCLNLAKRATVAIARLRASQYRYAESHRRGRT